MPPLHLLWASPNTLLDTCNGAALMIRECLKQLEKKGCRITILSGTTFVNSRGIAGLGDHWHIIKDKPGHFVTIAEAGLEHQLLVTRRTERRLMLSYEEQRWFDKYCELLAKEKPDIVLFFDNSLITQLTASEAQHQGIPVGVFLMHSNNRGTRWCRDVDLILTDTKATATMYKKREGYDVTPIGTFIDPELNRAKNRTPSTILFVNPIPQKGVYIVIQLALLLEQTRPDIVFEIIDTRATWENALVNFTTKLGTPRTELPNVRITANTTDMTSAYARAKILLAPSLGWDSGPRVIVEALLNGVPVISSQAGGIPEVVGKGGFVINFPGIYQPGHYERLYRPQELKPVCDLINRMYDDEEYYARCADNARQAHRQRHDINKNSDYLLSVIRQCVNGSERPESAK